MSVKLDNYTKRGLIYGLVSFAGLGYELILVGSPRLFLVIMYSLVLVFSLYCILFLKDSDVDKS
jgi:hypothetical protein